jgi:hypothetical protein
MTVYVATAPPAQHGCRWILGTAGLSAVALTRSRPYDTQWRRFVVDGWALMFDWGTDESGRPGKNTAGHDIPRSENGMTDFRTELGALTAQGFEFDRLQREATSKTGQSRVLRVDANLRRPSQHLALGVDRGPGSIDGSCAVRTRARTQPVESQA